MKKIDQIIEKINKKSIKLEDVIELDLDEQEYDAVMEALKRSGVDIEEKFEELEENNLYHTDIVKQYLEEIGRIPILTKEEEKTLFIEYSTTKDSKIREKLINSNLKLVVSIAKHYHTKTRMSTIDFLDLIQDGNEGLMKAIDKYDVRLGYKFSTYASWWVRQGITRSLSDISKTVRIPVHMQEFINKIMKYINDESVKTGVKPEIQEIAEYFKVSEEKVRLALDSSIKNPLSLEEKISEESNATILDYTEDVTVNIESDYINKETIAELFNTMRECLTVRELTVISCRFGIVNELNDCTKPMTLEEVATKFGVTRERIRQIEAKAFRKIRIKEKYNKTKCLRI